MLQMYSTKQVATILGIPPQRLQTAAWCGKITPPDKSPAGNFVWTIRDIEAAAWVMKRFPEFKVWQQQQGGA